MPGQPAALGAGLPLRGVRFTETITAETQRAQSSLYGALRSLFASTQQKCFVPPYLGVYAGTGEANRSRLTAPWQGETVPTTTPLPVVSRLEARFSRWSRASAYSLMRRMSI